MTINLKITYSWYTNFKKSFLKLDIGTISNYKYLYKNEYVILFLKVKHLLINFQG